MRLFLSPLLRSLAAGLALLVALLVCGGPTHASGKSPPAAVKLPAPENLSAAARAEVLSRMGRHGNTMSNLVRALVLLDRPTITTLAGRIADEEVVAGVEGGGPDKLKVLLPKDFFAQQDALKSSARDLAASAAHGAKDDVMAEHFATLAKTCVACHSVYLRSSDKSR